jgi:hypothetical protein
MEPWSTVLRCCDLSKGRMTSGCTEQGYVTAEDKCLGETARDCKQNVYLKITEEKCLPANKENSRKQSTNLLYPAFRIETLKAVQSVADVTKLRLFSASRP